VQLNLARCKGSVEKTVDTLTLSKFDVCFQYAGYPCAETRCFQVSEWARRGLLPGRSGSKRPGPTPRRYGRPLHGFRRFRFRVHRARFDLTGIDAEPLNRPKSPFRRPPPPSPAALGVLTRC
jgi:hypothetical protein